VALPPRDYSLYLVSRGASIVGYQILSVVIGWHVFSLTGRALDLGYVGLAQFVPAIALSLVTGQVADRLDRRRILIVCFVAELFTAAALLAVITSDATRKHLVPIYALLVVFGAARAFSGPAAQALSPNLVPKEMLPRAVAWSSTVWQLSTIVGPALGGLLYGVVGAKGAIGLSMLLVAGAAIAVALVRGGGRSVSVPSANETKLPAEGKLHELFAGLTYVFREKAILGTISLDLFAVLLPMFAARLSVGPMGLGLLRSAPAFGASVTAILLGIRPLRRHAGNRMLIAVALFGLATIGFGLSKSFVVSLVCLVVLGSADMVSVVVRRTLLQVRVPDVMRGRVYAVGDVFVGASNELGEFESGLTAAWLGPELAVVVGGVGTCVVVVLWALFFPDLRKIDRLTEEEKAP
jgi:MFS family permease